MANTNQVTVEDVKKLRKEIVLVLGSLFLDDYKNTMGFTVRSVSNFFDGYLDFLHDLMEEDGIKDWDFWREIAKYDNEETLEEWFLCFDECPLQKKRKKK